MKVGDLVSIERASIGVAKGTLAMITALACRNKYGVKHTAFSTMFYIYIIGSPRNGKCPRRYFSEYLKVIQEA